MAAAAALKKLRSFWDSQVNDEEKRAFNFVSASLVSQFYSFFLPSPCSCVITAIGLGSIMFASHKKRSHAYPT